MKMILFRPTFVAATTTLSLVFLLCALVTPISAVPQFGRPLLHVLDESPVGSGLGQASASATAVVSSAGIAASTAVPTDSEAVVAEIPTPTPTPPIDDTTQTPAVDPVNPLKTVGATSSQTLAQTNGAPRPGGMPGGGVAVALVWSVAVSAVFVLF